MKLYLSIGQLEHLEEKEQAKLKKLRTKTEGVEERIKILNSTIQHIRQLYADKGMNEEGLYPCKKCGGNPIPHISEGYENNVSHSIRCSKCDISVRYNGDDAEGVDKWNLENGVSQ